MNPSKKLFTIALLMVILVGGLFILKDFNITWVEVSNNQAVATVNFLFPMNQDKLGECIKIEGLEVDQQQYQCAIEWMSPTTAKIAIKETGEIRGQKIKLIVEDAPTEYSWLHKREVIPIQFKESVTVIEPSEEILISTEDSFLVKFSTPMNPHILHKYLKSDASFYIEPVKSDQSVFKFTPVIPLDNNRKYILSFSKGMPALSGVMLEEELSVVLQTDSKPEIVEMYPEQGSKWIGLYPKVTLKTNQPIVAATLDLGNQQIKGKIKEGYYVEFVLPKMLEPNHMYEWNVQVEAKTGERSLPSTIKFTTVPIPEDRIWIEVKLDSPHQIIAYQGKKQLRQMVCSAGVEKYPTAVGTYYVQGKGEKFFQDEMNRGANYWVKVSEQIMIHGMLRDEYWTPIYKVEERLGAPQTRGNIILSEEDAKWLYEKVKEDTMVIIH
ncbi:MAG: L,D-transpeptidase [Cellulosilyticaceae bacterium]